MSNDPSTDSVSAPLPPVLIPKLRPGISNETIQKLKIRRVNASEALHLTGLESPGIYIPFEGVVDSKKRPYGRLRLDVPDGDKKYHQRKGSGVHNYILPGLTLHNGDLLMVEGEFKAISLIEAGFPAIGTSGFYSWGIKRNEDESDDEPPRSLEADFAKTLSALKPNRIVYVGDPDTALNYQFSDAMVKMAGMTKIPVALFRIEYSAPNGKGVDDIKDKLGDAKFKTWFQHGLDNAKLVPSGINRVELLFSLIERERSELTALSGDAVDKAQKRMVNAAVYLSELQREKISDLAKELLKLNKTAFKKAVRERQIELIRERRARKPKSAIIHKGVLHDFCMIGEEFWSYTTPPDPISGKRIRSKTMSVCLKDSVYQSLRNAGYSDELPSTKMTPVCGFKENLSEQQAALLYLSETRCVGKTAQLYRPYGPTLFPDGNRYFNDCNVEVLQPHPTAIDLTSPEIGNTMTWLNALFYDEDALEHIISLLSYAYKAAYNKAPKKTLAVFLIGPPSSGKSFFIDKFVPNIFGQDSAADAHRLFKGEAGSSSVLSSYVCKLSDKDIGNRSDIARLQNGMLSLLADFTTGGRLLYENVKTVEVINLFMLSSNPDGSVVKLLQGMPQSVLDKFCVYDCEGGFADLNSFYKEIFEHKDEEVPSLKVESILEELPYFCSFLLSWNGKKFHEPRFGVKPRIPAKYANSKIFTPKAEVISELLQDIDAPFSYASSIYATLSEQQSSAVILKHIGGHEFVDILSSIAEKQPDLVTEKVSKGGKNRTFRVTGKEFRAKQKDSDIAHSTDTGASEVTVPF